MANIFFLFGNDEFAISRRLKEFESDFTDPTSADMNTARLDARATSEDDLNNAINAMPFLAKRRLVLLQNVSSKYNNPSARKKFLEFIEKELIPWTEATYRTVPFRMLAGHSAGGNFALHAMRMKPTLFQAIIAASPWLAWDDRRELQQDRLVGGESPDRK